MEEPNNLLSVTIRESSRRCLVLLRGDEVVELLEPN